MNAIGRLRVFKGLKQKDVASKAKISLSLYGGYEQVDLRSLKRSKLMLIANVLGVTTEDLLSGKY
jgi:transcriptional regulator with XRE-family HTH domain